MYSFMFDIPVDGQWGFQPAGTQIMAEIANFYNYVCIYLVFVGVIVSWFFFSVIKNFTKSKRVISHKYLVHGTELEMVWTVTPALILAGIAVPSFQLLYLIDECITPGVTLKVVGHQWYWSYEYSDYAPNIISFDSYIVPDNQLNVGDFRLLEVDNKVVVPVDTHIRVIVTAADVIHSWAVPSLGVKIDCFPGRLNQTSIIASRASTFYGSCAEVCGTQHAYMPIVIQAVPIEDYCAFIASH